MRVAFFSPLPPTKSGIADYSAALLESVDGESPTWKRSASEPAAFDASRYDVCVYQTRQQSAPRFRV